MKQYTQETTYFNFSHPTIKNIYQKFENDSIQNKIKGLYVKIRDGWRYNPFRIGVSEQHYIASNIAQQQEAHCIDKAILYTTCLRAFHIPARLHLAKVSNHIATERLEQILGTNALAPHGLVDVYFNNNWVKCSPAFNKELCQRYNVDALDFDGTEDMVMQEYNKDQQKFMSYIEDYGHFDDVPVAFMLNTFKENYPTIYEQYKGHDEIIIK